MVDEQTEISVQEIADWFDVPVDLVREFTTEEIEARAAEIREEKASRPKKFDDMNRAEKRHFRKQYFKDSSQKVGIHQGRTSARIEGEGNPDRASKLAARRQKRSQRYRA